jgi:hypothetical protein
MRNYEKTSPKYRKGGEKMAKLIEYTSDQTLSQTINLDEDGILRGVGSKQVTIYSTANPIVRVSSNFSNLHKSAVIENITLLGLNGTETHILLEDVYNCLIRNVAIKNADIGIKLTATANKWTEATRIEHVRMAWVNKGIQFVKGAGTGAFGFTHIDDVGISLKDAQDLTGIEVGTNCILHAPLIKANVWSSQKCDGMYIDGTIKAGLVNFNHEKTIGHVEGNGVKLGPNAVVNNNQNFDHSTFFVSAGHLSNAVYNQGSNQITSKTYATTGYYVSSIDSNFNENVTNPTYIVGSTNNAQYARIDAPSYGQTGRVCGNMNTQASGHIYLYGYSQTGYSSHLYVYVSNDKQNWTNVTYDKTITQSTPYWIDCGSSNPFNYILVLVYHTGQAARLYVDSVAVTP